MLDAPLRRHLEGPLDAVAGHLDRAWVTPERLTLAGLALGLTSALCASQQWWAWALATWLLSRLMDGFDGPLARRRAAASGSGVGAAGGFLDITADFLVYGATVVGVAVGSVTDPAGLASWLPFAGVLLAYYVNGTAFLAFSSVAERTGHQIDDGRSFSFLGGLAEGGETILVHTLWLVLPMHAPLIATVWAVVVGVSGAHRMVVGYRTLRSPAV